MTFFLKAENSIFAISGLKPNKSKCEIAGIGILKGVEFALCGMKYAR